MFLTFAMVIFDSKPIPESTHVTPSTIETLSPKVKEQKDSFSEEPPKKRKYNKKKGPKKMDAKKA